MQGNDLFGVLAFLSIFEILGGAALGGFLRGVLQKKLEALNFFFLIWGGGFAGIPLLIGAAIFLTSGHPSFFVIEAFVLGLTILIVGLTPAGLFQGLDADPSFGAALLGAVMTMIGAGIVLFTLRQGIGGGVLIGSAIGAIGAVILMHAVVTVLHTQPK